MSSPALGSRSFCYQCDDYISTTGSISAGNLKCGQCGGDFVEVVEQDANQSFDQNDNQHTHYDINQDADQNDIYRDASQHTGRLTHQDGNRATSQSGNQGARQTGIQDIDQDTNQLDLAALLQRSLMRQSFGQENVEEYDQGQSSHRVPHVAIIRIGGALGNPTLISSTSSSLEDAVSLFRLILRPELFGPNDSRWTLFNRLFGAENLASDPRDYVTSDNMLEQIMARLMEQADVNFRGRGLAEHELTLLARTKIDDDRSNVVCEQCAICQELFKPTEDAILLDCDHQFHKDCIEPWLKRVASCPTCRQPVIKPHSS